MIKKMMVLFLVLLFFVIGISVSAKEDLREYTTMQNGEIIVLELYGDDTFIFREGGVITNSGIYKEKTDYIILYDNDKNEIGRYVLDNVTFTFTIYEPNSFTEKATVIKDWIVALVVSFIGSGTFFGLILSITNKIIKRAKEKIVELENESKISKQQAEECVELLENFRKEVIPQVQAATDIIKENIEIDKAKQEKINELLNKLLGDVVNEEETN